MRTSALHSAVLWARPNEPRSEASSISALDQRARAVERRGTLRRKVWRARPVLELGDQLF
jgi:hypothetical protein